VQVAGNAKTGTVRLRFGKTSIQVLVFTNLRVGEWMDLPKWECQGAGGWESKNEGSKAQIYQNKHLGAYFHKSEGWEMGRACQNETVKVAGPAKMRVVRHRFAKMSTWVLVFTNPRVRQWPGLPKWERQGGGGWESKNEGSKTWICQNEHPGAHFHKSEGWGMGRACQNETVKGAGGWACKNEGSKAQILQIREFGGFVGV